MTWGRGKIFKTFLRYNKSEQRGIIILLIIIALIIGVRFAYPFYNKKSKGISKENIQQTEAFLLKQQKHSDSIEIVNQQNKGQLSDEQAHKKIKPFYFNPNNLPQRKWLEMGFTQKQVSIIKNYEKKGGTFSAKSDVKKIYSISDKEFEIIEPYIVIPGKEEKKFVKKKKKYSFKQTNISAADSAELVKNLKLRPEIAARTVAFRNSLGGFFSTHQLAEVYGMTNNYFKRIVSYLCVDTTTIEKIDINKVTFSDLLSHPYFDYQTTSAIINSRKKGAFENYNQIREITIVNDSVYNRIRPYIAIKNNNE